MESNNSTSSFFVNQTQEYSNSGLKNLSQLLPIAIAITLTNGLVLVLFYRRKSLCTASNYLLLSLSVCDLLTGALNIPYFIVFNFGFIPLKSLWSYLMFILQTLMAISAGYHILVITAEKHFAIAKPLRHHLLTKSAVCKISLGMWTFSAGFALVHLAWHTHPSRLLFNIIHSAFCLLMVFFIPYVYMIYAYIAMFRAISKHEIPRSQNEITRSRFQKKKINDRKCILVFATMATVYAVCWLPYFTVMLISNVRDYLRMDEIKSMSSALEAFAIIRFLTSVINPVLYTFFKRDFWLALKALPVTRGLTFAVKARTKWTRRISLSESNCIGRQSIFLDGKVSLMAFGKVNQAFTDDGHYTATTM